MKPKAVKVFAPATIANLGSGFDILGLAINAPGDFVYAERCREPGLSFSLKQDHSAISADPNENVAGHVANLLLNAINPSFGIRLVLDKRMPIGSGLGSSAASSVAAAMAVNALLAKPLPRMELLKFTMEGERKASGTAHADNVAPSLLGGVCLVRSYAPLDVIQLPIKNKFFWVVVHPDVVVRTEDARGLLPKNIELSLAIKQWGNVSAFTAALLAGDANLIKKSCEDVIAEPLRATLIPNFAAVKQAALTAGALGCSISGSGPSIFAVANNLVAAKKIAGAMVGVFTNVGKIKCNHYISKINLTGAAVTAIKSL